MFPGGNPPQRPDQIARPPAMVLAPGSSSGIFRGRQVVVYGTGPGSGIFVYSPAPGTGTLLASITEATADPYGNPTVPGITLYDTSGKPRIELATGSNPYLQLLNSAGAVIGLLSNRLDALLWYEDTGTATQGKLLASIAGAAGTDGNGNSFPLGAEIFQGQFDGTNYVINSAGAFFYSGAPASGNLIASITNAAGSDTYGNAYDAGITAYDPSTGEYAQLTGGSAAIGVSGTQTGALIGGAPVTITSGPVAELYAIDGASTLSTILDLVGPASPGAGAAYFYGWEPTASSTTDVTVGVLGSVKALIAGSPGSSPTVETTHPLGALGVTGIDITVSNYYRLPDGGIFISIKGSATGTVSAGSKTFPNALPAGYQPATGTLLPAMFGGNIAAGEPRPRLVVNTNGDVTLYYPGLVSGNSISAGGRFDLQ